MLQKSSAHKCVPRCANPLLMTLQESLRELIFLILLKFLALYSMQSLPHVIAIKLTNWIWDQDIRHSKFLLYMYL